MNQDRSRNRTSTPPRSGFRDIEVLYTSGDRVCYRMYAEMYERTMEYFLGLNEGSYTFVVAYILDWCDPTLAVPAAGKSYLNLNQICSIDIIGLDNERSE